MTPQPPVAMAARVSTPSGLVTGIPEGTRLVFGRCQDADLTVSFFTQLLPSSTYPIRAQLRQLIYQALTD